MSPNGRSEILARVEYPEAVVLSLLTPDVREGEPLSSVRDALYREADASDRAVVLDLSAVQFLTSAALGMLLTLRRRLMDRGRAFRPPCRRGLFAQFPDAATALDAIRQGESDPLVLCGVAEGIRDMFLVC